MKQIIGIIGLIFTAISVSCSGEKKPGNIPARPDMAAFRGKTSESIICRNDSNNSYALFLPSAYDTTHSWPVIIAFDSHGDGLLPVTLLSELADKYGTIVIGSNNSKNGLSTELTSAMYDALIADAKWRFSIDNQRVYTMGFSGGARVAAYQALNKSGIRGVIGCSAGLPSNSIPPGAGFQYLGVVGSDDFNLLEMTALFKSLDGSPIPHYLMVFEGTHAWPPKETLADIFIWMHLSEMKDGLIQKDEDWISAAAKGFEERAGEMAKQKNWMKELEINAMAKYFFGGFPQEKKFDERDSTLRSKQEVLHAIKLREDWLLKEQSLQKQYLAYLQAKDGNWWTKDVKRLQDIIRQKPGSEEAHVYKRLLSYMSLVCYMNAMQLQKSGPPDAFRYIVMLYALVDPENSETAYLQAVVDARAGQADNALKSLHKALTLGFKDSKRIEQDSSFLKMRNIPGFIDLINKIR